MHDLLVLTLLVAACICAVGYVRACDGLTRSEGPIKETSHWTWQGWLQIVIFSVLIIVLIKPFGGYITRNVAQGPLNALPVLPGSRDGSSSSHAGLLGRGSTVPVLLRVPPTRGGPQMATARWV